MEEALDASADDLSEDEEALEDEELDVEVPVFFGVDELVLAVFPQATSDKTITDVRAVANNAFIFFIMMPPFINYEI